MEETKYQIGLLVGRAWMESQGYDVLHLSSYSCDEGKADLVAKDSEGTTVLMSVEARRARKAESGPTVSQTKARRVSTSYLVEHPEVESLRFSAMVVRIGDGNTATVKVEDTVWEFER